jgi:nitrite reductase (NADH) large subunit
MQGNHRRRDRRKGLTDLTGVRAHTKASASCGSCTGLVEQILAITLGDSFKKADVEPMCGCTDLGHDDVRRLIVAKELKSIPQVMQELEWKTSCGCAKCRPALNYYLLCDWPEEYTDDSQSRFINERVHANIQKDGTYSVVPRMWGGMTSPSELRAIADVADKFAIPAVKVTGGQRIDLLGVKKEDLPAVWADLNKAGMVSGHAYAKGLRTVKTCVGTDWCRFGTQDSTGLGIKIEKFMWGSWTPAKVKMAVSGCPRNCAEATCKDVGVICVESGYEISFAGAAGLHVRQTDFSARSRPRRKASRRSRPSRSFIANRAAIWNACTNGPCASGSTPFAQLWSTTRLSGAHSTSASSSRRRSRRSTHGPSASGARKPTSSLLFANSISRRPRNDHAHE